MFFDFAFIRHLIGLLRSHLQTMHAEPEAGYSTEAVIVTALLGAWV